ncbi:hypothetical protein [Dactylosporangium sp. CS-033363]|uniref:hypothetical protein n=1 Tax=Dactylosporangium sp. CS-033363 TaxID=3239935 RepID=UPI003D940515
MGLPRGWGLLLALGLTMSLVSAVPLPPAPAEIVRQPLRNGAFQLAGDVLLVLENDRTPTPVEAFDAGDGHSRWTYTPDGLTTLSYAASAPGAGDVVVLWPDLCRSGVTGTTVAVDRRTGREVWHAPGVPVRTAPGVPGTVVLRSLWSDGCGALAANAPIGGGLRWQALGPGGEPRWELPVDAGTRVAVDSAEAGASWAALADRHGALGVADFVTGRRETAGDLVAASGDIVAAAGDLLIVAAAGAGSPRGVTTLTAYRRGAWSAPLWRTDVPTVPASGRSDRFTVRACGAMLCATGQLTFVLDPATGVVRWAVGGYAQLAAVPGGLLTEPGASIVHLYDPATGAEAPRLDGWQRLGADDDRLLLGAPDGEEATLLGFRQGDRVLPIGTVDARIIACELDGARVACSTADGDVVLFRLAT